MEKPKKSASLFNSESEDKSFSSESHEQIDIAKNKIKNSKPEYENAITSNNNYITNNQIELKYITEINKNVLYFNLEKMLLNQDSLANLMKNIFHRILKTNSMDQSYNDIHRILLHTKIKFFDDLFPPNINSLIKGYHKKKIF